MSFNTALSGVNAAQRDLNVTSNNIANANSIGFKKSRAEFGDIYATSAYGNSKTAVGQGVLNQAVSQQFSQGSLQFTDNALDLAIQGEGFFVFQPDAQSDEQVFSRAGALGIDKDGFIVNSFGQFLKGYQTDAEGNVLSTGLDTAERIQIDAAAGAPEPTTEVLQRFNLPADAENPGIAFDPDNPDSYNQASSQRIYDSLGNPLTLTTYYVKTANNNEWEIHYQVENLETQGPNTITFDGSGQLDPIPDDYNITVAAGDLGTGADELNFAITIDPRSTQFSSPFSMVDQRQNGRTTGQLTGLEVSNDGIIRAKYSNGESKVVSKVALADFRNPQGLEQIGNNQWRESVDSGDPQAGQAGVGTFGQIQGGALEASNVDLTEELVNLITAQRNFQANSRAIETNKALSDTIINIR